MFERIDTICLTVSNIEEATAWYEKLGFTVSFKGEGYRVLNVGNSGVPLTIEEGVVTNKDHSIYPIFYTKDINDTYLQLEGKGVRVTEIQSDGHNQFFDFYDLDNNRLQVCFWK